MASSIVQDTNTTVRGLGGKKIRIPYVAFGADLEYLNEVMRELITKIHLSKEDK